MAVAAEVVLLVALISNIHAEIILRAGNPRTFILNDTADFCSVSRWTGEEKKLLWNSSAPRDSSVERKVSYRISSLKVSHSGLYQRQCWTQGRLTLSRNSSLLVCGRKKMKSKKLYPNVGQTVELTCDAAGPNQRVQWALQLSNHKTGNVILALIDDETTSVSKHKLVKNNSSLLVTVNEHHGGSYYHCLDKNHQRCNVLRQFYVQIPPKFILRSVGESVELNCSGISGNQSHVWRIKNALMYDVESHNYTLMFPSLTLNHTGLYKCKHNNFYRESYDMFVCPKSDPPAVAFFTGGGNVTLQCGNWTQTDKFYWYMRSNRTEGKVSYINKYQPPDNMDLSDMDLVITNVSLEDSGEFWCMIKKDRHCVFTSKTLLMFREPEVDHHLVRSVLLSVVIVMMCVVAVATVWSTRSRAQLPAPVEELEMSELSPASADLQLETPV